MALTGRQLLAAPARLEPGHVNGGGYGAGGLQEALKETHTSVWTCAVRFLSQTQTHMDPMLPIYVRSKVSMYGGKLEPQQKQQVGVPLASGDFGPTSCLWLALTFELKQTSLCTTYSVCIEQLHYVSV